ncbi:MAG: AI-2E family transporter [Pseudomonadota bacterium]
MALPRAEQLRYWSIAAGFTLLVLWLLGDVILPFVLGGALAYLLDPIADWLQEKGLSRIASVILITLIATVVFAVVLVLVLPQMIEQAAALIQAIPPAVQDAGIWLSTRFPELADENSGLRQSLDSFGSVLEERATELLDTVLGSALSLINILILVFLVPVVTFYLLVDWDRMVAEIDALLPRDHAPTIRKIMGDIDKTLASFIRGQGTVCLILGTYYAVALVVAGLQYGLVVGFVAGLISFIPYVGALIGGVASVGLALFQFWGEWWMVAVIAAIFFAGQMVEGNILTPNLVGSSVGLHPVWLLFALSVFGSLFGFVGMLVAVPLAAAIGVLTRFLIGEYLDSRLYKGVSGTKQD